VVVLPLLLLALQLLFVSVGLLDQPSSSGLALRRWHGGSQLKIVQGALPANIPVVPVCVVERIELGISLRLGLPLTICRLDLRKHFVAASMVVILSCRSVLGATQLLVHHLVVLLKSLFILCEVVARLRFKRICSNPNLRLWRMAGVFLLNFTVA
jgi:hypothetical protein